MRNRGMRKKRAQADPVPQIKTGSRAQPLALMRALTRTLTRTLTLGLMGVALAACDAPSRITEPAPPQTFVAVAAGALHTCAIRIDGVAFCWGDGTLGQLGNGANVTQGTPSRVSGSHTWVSVTAGQRHSCGLTDQGAVQCWGWNFQGQLGDATTFTQLSPVPIASTLRFVEVAAGLHHTCALAVDQTVWCWGAAGQGRLGNVLASDTSVPTQVGGADRFTSLAAGGFHTCAVRTDRRAVCWGLNHAGQLGDGSSLDRATPTPVLANLEFRSLGAGFSHTCGVTTDGRAFCWGEVARGAIGDRTDGPAGASNQLPSQVFAGAAFDQVSAGLHYTCALDQTRRIQCWGAGTEGQLGDPRLRDWATPQLVTTTDQATFRRVEASWGVHTCGLSRGSALYCWGRGDVGQLGNGTTTFTATPVRVQVP